MRASLAILLLTHAFSASAAAPAPTQVLQRKLTTRDGTRDLTIILPPDYQPTRRYPVLYLLDGANLLAHPVHAGGWRADKGLTEAVHSGAEPMIIVGVHTTNRLNEYTTTPDPNPRNAGGGGGAQFIKYLAKEVVPYIEQNFATRAGASGRAIGGSSLGGLLSMHALMTKTFGRGLVLSPSVWWNNKQLLDAVSKFKTSKLLDKRVVLYNGGAQDEPANSEALRDLLHQKGMQFNQNLFHWGESGATHDEAAWAKFLPKGLAALFPAGSSAAP